MVIDLCPVDRVYNAAQPSPSSLNHLLNSITSNMQPEDMSNFFASVAATQDNIAREVSSASMQIDSFWREVATSSDKAREYAEARLNDFQSDPEKTAQITEFRALDNELVTAGNELQAVVDNAAQAGNADAQHVNENDGNSEKPFGSIFERLQAAFPPPDHAPGHEERQRSIHNALAEVQTALANFLLQLGVPEESFRGVLDKLFPVLERIMVLIGKFF